MRNMIGLLQKIDALFKSARSKPTKGRRKTAGQSLVEFGITLPVLILLFTGMVEFGFMLNTYLSLQDAIRTSARRYSLENPQIKVNGAVVDDPTFYQGAADAVVNDLMPSVDTAARQVFVDPTRDNVLISVITISVDEAPDPDVIDSIIRHPNNSQFFKLYNDTSPATQYSDTKITETVTANGGVPVDAGLLIIEVFYSYEGVLHLPWTEPFFSEANPSMLYASTIMPLVSAKP